MNGNDETKKKLNLLKLEDQITTSVTSHTQSALNFIKSDLPPSCCTYCLFLMFMLFACSLLQDYIFPNYSFDSQGLVSAKETFLNDNEMITKILDDHMKGDFDHTFLFIQNLIKKVLQNITVRRDSNY